MFLTYVDTMMTVKQCKNCIRGPVWTGYSTVQNLTFLRDKTSLSAISDYCLSL